MLLQLKEKRELHVPLTGVEVEQVERNTVALIHALNQLVYPLTEDVLRRKAATCKLTVVSGIQRSRNNLETSGVSLLQGKEEDQ